MGTTESGGMPGWQVFSILSTALIGLFAALLTVWNLAWRTKQTRHEGLSVILRHLVSASNHLTEANDKRHRAESLRMAFPDGGTKCQALEKANECIEAYNQSVSLALEACKKAKEEFACTSFRLPDRIREVLAHEIKEVIRYGELVNDGDSASADLQHAKVQDTHTRLMRLARGWRLVNPIQSLRKKRLEKKIEEHESQPAQKREIAEDRLNIITKLVHKRFTDHRHKSFAVHPPKILLDDPGIAIKDSVVGELEGKSFRLVFQDGESELLSFPEFIVFNYQVILAAVEMRDIAEKLERGGFGPTEVVLKSQFSLDELMRPEMVKAILGKVDFSPPPCDDNKIPA